MDLTLEKLETVYRSAFDNCALQPEIEPTVRGIVGRMVQLRPHYESAEKVTGVPWWFIGILHYSEWNFREPEQFERQVVDILIAKKYHQAKTRTLGAFLWGFDLWNGFQEGAGKESTWVWGWHQCAEAKNISYWCSCHFALSAVAGIDRYGGGEVLD